MIRVPVNPGLLHWVRARSGDTHETPADTLRKVKIPNTCVGLGLCCISPYQMLRQERARFVLG